MSNTHSEAEKIVEKYRKNYTVKSETEDFTHEGLNPAEFASHLVKDIASALSARDVQHAAEVEALRDTVERRMRFDFMDPDQVMIAFDSLRSRQVEGREKSEITFNGYPVVTDKTLKPGEWVLEPGKPMRSNPPTHPSSERESGG